MKLTEKQKQKICDYLEQALNNSKLDKLIENGTGNKLLLVDLLSVGDDISEGKKEITNIVEQIYFDMQNWDI